ncbi:hypothetical protein EG329_003370 [Mollisiaceae sp. DMI_Dod_QoI]|nr:hypothetical protein EG329_003370 [Helotiales sp. DMI_Dod_QoI]
MYLYRFLHVLIFIAIFSFLATAETCTEINTYIYVPTTKQTLDTPLTLAAIPTDYICPTIDTQTADVVFPITKQSIIPTIISPPTTISTAAASRLRNLDPFQWKLCPNRTIQTQLISSSPTSILTSSTYTWDPIPASILDSQGACPSAATTEGAASTGTVSVNGGANVNGGVKTSAGNKNELGKAQRMVMGVAAGLVVVWVIARAFVKACVAAPAPTMAGLGGF